MECSLCSAFNSDLPCMHLDPGVNRLGLNVTSIHQTDRRPVTPDIVFPICVILRQWEEGLKKKNSKTTTKKKRGQYISQIHSKIRERSVVRLLAPGKKSVIYERANGKHANQRGRRGFKWAEHPWEGRRAEAGDGCGAPLEGLCALNTNTMWRLPYFQKQAWSCRAAEAASSREEMTIWWVYCGPGTRNTQAWLAYSVDPQQTECLELIWFLMQSNDHFSEMNSKLRGEKQNISKFMSLKPNTSIKRGRPLTGMSQSCWISLSGCANFKVLQDKSRSELHHTEYFRVLWLLTAPLPRGHYHLVTPL